MEAVNECYGRCCACVQGAAVGMITTGLRLGPDREDPSTEEMASSGGHQWQECPCRAQDVDDMV